MKRRSPVEQVDDILALNARILAMNEKLLQAILKHNNVNQVEMLAPMDLKIFRDSGGSKEE